MLIFRTRNGHGGNGHGGNDCGRGNEHGGHGCGRGNGHGKHPHDIYNGDGCSSGNLQRGRLIIRGSEEGIGRGRASSSSAPPPPRSSAVAPPLPRSSAVPPPPRRSSTVPPPPPPSPEPEIEPEPEREPANEALEDEVPPAIGDLEEDEPAPPEHSSNSRPLLKISHKSFIPSHLASGQITKCIKQRLDKEGYTWSAVSKQTKDFYWKEFLKHFSFDRDLSVVRNVWEPQAGMRYSGTLCEWRKKGQRPMNVPQETWDSWQQKWNTPEYMKKCSIASNNRLSEVAGLGNGLSKHCGGSRSAIDHGIQLAKELGRAVTDYDIFVRMHKKRNGEFVDKRSKKVAEEVMTRYNAVIDQNQNEDGENSTPAVDLSSIYYEVVGPLKKQRIYGLGCKPSAAIPSCSSSKSTELDCDQLRAKLSEEVREEMRQREEEMEHQMRQRHEEMELEWKQKLQEMENVMQVFSRGGEPSISPSNLEPGDDEYQGDHDLDEHEMNDKN